jgi:hypothetical protein
MAVKHLQKTTGSPLCGLTQARTNGFVYTKDRDEVSCKRCLWWMSTHPIYSKSITR